MDSRLCGNDTHECSDTFCKREPGAPEQMLKLVIGMQNNTRSLKNNSNGFTLIEILVVIVIVGITLSFALLAFGDFGSQRRIRVAAEQFINYVNFVQQQAILETATLGIMFNQNTYQVVKFQPPKTWQAMPKKSVFHLQHFPSDAIIRLDSHSTINNTPSIIINASGDMSPFKLNVGSSKNNTIAVIRGESNGELVMQPVASP